MTMNFDDALDLLIATAITCLRHDNPKLRRAVEIAINYREFFPTTPPAISLQQLELLGAWLSSKPTGMGVLGVGTSSNKGGHHERIIMLQRSSAQHLQCASRQHGRGRGPRISTGLSDGRQSFERLGVYRQARRERRFPRGWVISAGLGQCQ